jgi:rare lipoprotein A
MANQSATAAHKTLPMGTRVRVTNVSNGKSEVVTINDRGPFVKGRIIDVSKGSAERLGFLKHGVALVRIEVLGRIKSLVD